MPFQNKNNPHFDLLMMKRAIELGEKGRITAPPNPWVGCVLVKDELIIGEGYHYAAGQPHAEVNALKSVTHNPHGATAYVTLEPCSHYGKTPPCVNALIEAGIARVVIAQSDPDIRVGGNGIKALQNANIQVDLGIGEKEARDSLAPYIWQRSTKKPFCVGKAAVSIDGRIAATDGSSKWISCPEALQNAHELRAQSQVILIGARTAIIDKSTLTVRHCKEKPIHPPLRVILDARGELSSENSESLFDTSQAPTLIFTSSQCPEQIKQAWKNSGLEVIEVNLAPNGKLDLNEMMLFLGSRGILQVLVEGGGNLLSALQKENLINKLVLYVGPCILGDKGIPLFRDLEINSMSESIKLKLSEISQLNRTIRMDYSF